MLTLPRRPVGLSALLALSCRGEVDHPPGMLVEREPLQQALEPPRALTLKGFRLEEVASFYVEARVLSRKDYPLYWYHYLGFEQYFEQISPMDLALGWNIMSDSALLEQLEIGQYKRFYSYRWSGSIGVSGREIGRNSSNMHLVPDGPRSKSQLLRVRVGDVVRLVGSLVNASHPPSGRFWRTSTSRDDRGAGACEIVYVKSVAWVPLAN